MSETTSHIELEEVLEKLVTVKGEYRPHPANLIVGAVIGTFCFIAGGVIVFYVTTLGNLADQKFQILLGLGALFLFSGSAACLSSWWRSSYRVILGSNGFAEITRRKNRMFRWEDIQSVLETVRLLPQYQMTSRRRTWTVFLRSGEKLEFDVQTVSHMDCLIAAIKAEIEPRGITWKNESKLMG